MRTMKTIAAALAAALTLGTSVGARAATGDQDVPRMNDPAHAPAVPPGTLVYKVHPGDVPPADMRRGQANRYERAAQGQNNGYYYERPRGSRANEYRDYEHRTWHRGDRLPPEYRSRSYVVDDWRGHHLHRPPAGYHWVQSGNDYLLVAIATGIIASVLLNQ